MTDKEKATQPLKVCLDARLISGTAGGVEQFIIGLAYGLSRLTDGQEEYHFLTYSDADNWIKPYLSGPCRLLHCVKSPRRSKLRTAIKSRSTLLENLLQKVYPFSERWKVQSLCSDGTIEKTGINIMHFTQQIAFLTSVPSIYHPHDLQHKHFPQYFSLTKRLARDLLYRTFCRRAQLVAVASSWIKSDMIRSYRLAEEKVRVIPLAPTIQAYRKPTQSDLTAVRQKFSLPDSFVFYPAQTWPHKNHLGLIDALANIRERFGMIMPVVFAGTKSDSFFPEIEQRIEELHLNAQSSFLGFVTPLELQSLYLLSQCVVIPTKYEAGSFPLWEAFSSGVPAACANVTSLPVQAGDAALIFDPDRPGEIADAVMQLWTDQHLRRTLIERGYRNVARYSWENTARTFRAHYRNIGRRPLTEEDRALLSALPLM